MKKIAFYTLLSAVALSTVSCDEDFNEDVAAPQEWPQEEAITLPGFAASAMGSVNLDSTVDSVAVFSFTTPSGMPEGTSIANFRLEVTPTEVEGAETVTVAASGNGKVATADLQQIIENAYGKRPVERTLNATLYANLMKDGQASLLTCAPIDIKATPEAPFISNAYYLVGDMAGWDSKSMMKFVHSDKDVYEDPVFTLMFTTTKANQYWKIIPQENVDAEADGVEGGFWQKGVVGVAVDGDDSMSGTLINGDGVNAGKIAQPGMYSLTLNMMDYTYTIKEIVPEYYIVGAMQSWNSDASKGKTCMLYPKNKMVHSYTTAFQNDANLKIWLGSDFGNWDACYGAASDGDNAAAGSLVGTGAGAIVCPEKSTAEAMVYYTFTADFSTMSYTWTKIENQNPVAYGKIGLIGDFNGWGGDFEMAQVTPHNWYVAGLTVEAAGGIKFRADADWAVNWGSGADLSHDLSSDNYGTATNNSGNLKIAAGVYNVYFNDITGEFVFVAVK